MSYRNKPRETSLLCDVASLSELHIQNGTVAELAFPCLYAIPPETPRRGCKPTPITEFEKIRLSEEGYADPVLAFFDPPDGLSGQAWIDEEDDHIVRMVISAQCLGATNESLKCRMALTTTRQTPDRGPRTDGIFRGGIVVVASPLPTSVL